MGGKPTAGLGFGLGMERLMLALDTQKIEFPEEPKCELYVAAMGAAALKKAFGLVNKLRQCGIQAECDLCGRGLKAQMKYANKIGSAYTIVLGDDELAKGEAELKNMKTGEKKVIDINDKFLDDYVTNVTMVEEFEI